MFSLLKLLLFSIIVLLNISLGFSQTYKKAQDTYVMVLDIQTTYTQNAMSSTQAEDLLKATNKVTQLSEKSVIIWMSGTKSFYNVDNQ